MAYWQQLSCYVVTAVPEQISDHKQLFALIYACSIVCVVAMAQKAQVCVPCSVKRVNLELCCCHAQACLTVMQKTCAGQKQVKLLLYTIL